MSVRTCPTILALCLVVMLAAARAQAQSSDVTFRMPLNLTNLSPDITRVSVTCRIVSPALPVFQGQPQAYRGEQFPVVAGRLVTTATVVVAIPQLNSPAGKTANYSCYLRGSTQMATGREFTENNSDPAFRLSPTPVTITGSFDWVSVDATAPPPPASTTSPGAP
jgi:hypothetical protein